MKKIVLMLLIVLVISLFLEGCSFENEDTIVGKASTLRIAGEMPIKAGGNDVPAALDTEAADLNGIYYVECTGDASVDTPALQEAIDESPGYILLSEGVCAVDKTIKILNMLSLRLEGQGQWRSILEWQGEEGKPMFSLQKARRTLFQNFWVRPSPGYSLLSAFDIYNDCFDETCGESWTPPSTGNVFMNLLITNRGATGILGNGIRILLSPNYSPTAPCGEGADCLNDKNRFFGVTVSGYSDTGFKIEGKNSKGNIFFASHCKGVRPVPDKEEYGNSCINTISSRGGYTSGAFYWYGGEAIGNKDADFVLGQHNDAVIISSLYSEKSRMLLRVENEENSNSRFPITLESIRFAEHNIHAWDNVPGLENPDGLIIDVNYRGPLTITGSDFGSPSLGSLTNLGICWHMSQDVYSSGGGFIFEGNALVTNRENPFNPKEGCYYPTSQNSNIINTWEETTRRYVPMPEHVTKLTISDSGRQTVRKLGTSYEYFEISGTGDLYGLQDGIVGQTIKIKGTDSTGTNICDASQDCAGVGANMHLSGGNNYLMQNGDTLVLTMFSDNEWYELSRTD